MCSKRFFYKRMIKNDSFCERESRFLNCVLQGPESVKALFAAALQNDIYDQCHNDQNGDLHTRAHHYRAAPIVGVGAAAMAIVSISSIHNMPLYTIRMIGSRFQDP